MKISKKIVKNLKTAGIDFFLSVPCKLLSNIITIIESMLDKIDHLIIGGGMVYTFIYALKGKIGNSIYEKDYANVALKIIDKAKSKKVSLHLPIDVVAGDNFSNDSNQKIFDVNNIKNGW